MIKAGRLKNNQRGMVQIYTGAGKGKTTAALGLALRALGHGKKVLLIQFMKKDKNLGEVKAARRFNKFKILQKGRKGWLTKNSLKLKDKQLAKEGLKAAQVAIAAEKYNLIILDELNLAVDFGLVKAQQVKELLESKPRSLEIVITGRSLHPEILEVADLVSEIRELKHYYKKGIAARKGIEY